MICLNCGKELKNSICGVFCNENCLKEGMEYNVSCLNLSPKKKVNKWNKKNVVPIVEKQKN
jgi:hypothetical protein